MPEHIRIPITLRDGIVIEMDVYADMPGTLEEIDEQQAAEYGESPYQLKEGAGYEYLLPKGYELQKSEIIRPSRIDSSRGRIVTNMYVGSLETGILHDSKPAGSVTLEIVSIKTGYRTDYRRMLEDITTRCTELLMQQSSVVNQTFTVDATRDPQTLYQRFSFGDSSIHSDHFAEAMHRINTMPVKRWESVHTEKIICNIRRAGGTVVRQMINAGNRTKLSHTHPLANRFHSLPARVNVPDKAETTDIPENRFIRYVIETFMQFCLSIYQHPQAGARLKRDALASSELLGHYLSAPVLKEVSELTMIPFHSPVLQRREGYREVLQAYLMFDMAASLIWKGGDDVYQGGKRDVARLYEYWLFFKLLELLEEVFGIKPRTVNDLIEAIDRNGEHLLELKLKSGRQQMIDGTFVAGNRPLHIEFYYNRTFSGEQRYPMGGSWTAQLRPDYTLSIRPEGLSVDEAERREMIVHIHFDAKYKIDNSQENYKRVDLLKMHTYRDAIRRTAGAYVLYPGKGKETFHSFHEVLPGIGAFPISPADNNHTALKEFLFDIVQHFLDRASQRELHSQHTYYTFRNQPGPLLHEAIPDSYNAATPEHPLTTYVLVGFYKDEAHLRWILSNKLYNLRTDADRGSLKLSHKTTGAKYLLLHGSNNSQTNLIFRISPGGPRVVSREYLIDSGYPSKPSKPYYIGFSLESAESIYTEFGSVSWDVRGLENYQPGRGSAIPFVVTVEEMMRNCLR